MVQENMNRPANPADPVLDQAIVLRLVRQHLRSASAVTTVDETGGEARVYIIDDKYIFKTQRPHRVRERTSIEKAVFFQRALAKDLPEVSVPRVLGYGREETIEYVLETRMPGVAVRNVTLNGPARRKFLEDLARTLGRVHSLTLDQFEQSGLFPGDKNESEVRSRIVDGLRRPAEAIASQADGWPLEIKPVALAERMINNIPNSRIARVALHSNPGPEHVFIDPTSLQFQGLIDFGDAYISHPAFDMRRWSSPDDWPAFIEGYQSEEPLNDSFLGIWQAIVVGGLMMTIAGMGFGPPRPERRLAALEELKNMAAEL